MRVGIFSSTRPDLDNFISVFIINPAAFRHWVYILFDFFSYGSFNMYDWFMVNEKMGSLRLRGSCSNKSNCSAYVWTLEYLVYSATRDSYIFWI
jgi:regulator of sigma D